MSLEKELEHKVEEVLETNTVKQATKIVRSRSGMAILGIISFFEAAFPLPILTDPFLIAAILVDRTRAVQLVLITILTSVAGGIVAYFMALFFFNVLMSWMSPALVDEFHTLLNGGGSSTMMLTLAGAITPVPYTLTAWVIAVLKGSLLVFIIGSIFGRGLRYALVGYSTYRFGHLAVSYAKRYIGIVSIIVLIAAVLYFWFKM